MAYESARRGIETRKFFYPLHIMPVFKPYVHKEEYPVATYLSQHGLNLPSGPCISDDEVISVAETIKRLYKRR